MTISTEGRVFVAQLRRDLAAREAAGARLLAPGATCWTGAIRGFAKTLAGSSSPVKAAKAFKAGIARLTLAQKEGACFVNAHMTRSRSGIFELLTWEVAKHPLTKAGQEGVLVRRYFCTLRRGGCIETSGGKLAFCSWHALARMRERSEVDVFESRGVVAGCGVAGLLMRQSTRHANTGLYYATSNTLLCAGVLRTATDEATAPYSFFDVLTAFQPNEEGPQVAQWQQGVAIATAVHKYMESDDADPEGYADDIAVLPPRSDDHVSRELQTVSTKGS
jgi:hypothetical protein